MTVAPGVGSRFSAIASRAGLRVVVSILLVVGLVGCGSTPAPSPVLQPSPEVGQRPPPSVVVPAAGSPTPSGEPRPAATPTLAPLLTARIDGGDWEITHQVTDSSYPPLVVGDLTIRVYHDVTYRCSSPPCDVALKTDDPNTVDKPRPATFKWRTGAYVATEVQTAIGRCDAPDGVVVANAYDQTITTTLRVTAVGTRNGIEVATRLIGNQVRQGAPTRSAAAHGCPAWTTQFTSTGQRNITPGQATTVRSRNWAGYVVARPGVRITDVRGSWIQPAIRCDGAARQFSSYWIGIDGAANDTLEQLGTEADCRNGRATYAAWWETIPEPETRVDLLVRPGDELVASIHSVGDRYRMSLRNRTTGHGFTKTVDWPRAEGASAEWIAEATSLCTPDDCEVQVLPDFGAVHFSGATAATAKSSRLVRPTDPSWQLERAVMITKGGRTKAEVSPLGVRGDAFTVTWRPLS